MRYSKHPANLIADDRVNSLSVRLELFEGIFRGLLICGCRFHQQPNLDDPLIGRRLIFYAEIHRPASAADRPVKLTLDGRPVDYFNIRWAETQVGDLNFELIEPRGGDNPWQRMLDAKGEGIGSIAVMFKTREESERVIEQFRSMDVGITAVGRIGDHIEWYYLDTEPGFKCIIESGSGHALDFMQPAAVYPSD